MKAIDRLCWGGSAQMIDFKKRHHNWQTTGRSPKTWVNNWENSWRHRHLFDVGLYTLQMKKKICQYVDHWLANINSSERQNSWRWEICSLTAFLSQCDVLTSYFSRRHWPLLLLLQTAALPAVLHRLSRAAPASAGTRVDFSKHARRRY